MENENVRDIFLENMPAFKVWYKLLLTNFYHFIIFVFILIIFWRIGNIWYLAVLPIQLLISSVSNIPFIYIAKNFDKLRKKYLNKYPTNTWQHFWYNYSYTSPFGAAALYSPLLLLNYSFFPQIIRLPTYFPYKIFIQYDFLAIIIGITIVVLGIILIHLSRDHDRDMDIYLYMIDPIEYKVINSGIYEFIRHPRFLSRLTISIGFGFIANNILAIGVALIHFLPYYACMRAEDKELIRRYGPDVQNYQNDTPALFPRWGNWRKFLIFFCKN